MRVAINLDGAIRVERRRPATALAFSQRRSLTNAVLQVGATRHQLNFSCSIAQKTWFRPYCVESCEQRVLTRGLVDQARQYEYSAARSETGDRNRAIVKVARNAVAHAAESAPLHIIPPSPRVLTFKLATPEHHFANAFLSASPASASAILAVSTTAPRPKNSCVTP